MKTFAKKYKLTNEQEIQIQYYLFGVRIFWWTLPAFLSNKNDRDLIICYDSLISETAEAIDMFSFFKYLQANNIPSRYILLKRNNLYCELKKQNKLKDIIVLHRYEQLFTKCANEISRAKAILASFGIKRRFGALLANNPCFKYIFAQHGSIFLKESVLELYSENNYNYIISATKKESELYDSHRLWQNGTQIKCGLPRWDALYRKPHNKKNIFVFFTWRTSIEGHPDSHKIYSDRIFDFLCDERLNKLLSDNNINLNIAMHHAMLRNNGTIDVPKNVNIISTDKISDAIKESDLCITDYSSIIFDFMYLDIPVIFYRFDDDIKYPDERDNQNAASAKSKDDQLYNCLYSKNDVINKIEFYIKNDFKLEPEFKDINNNIFWERSDICKHLYEIISK